MTIDLKATREGEDVEGGEVSGHSYKVGSGDMLEGLDDAVRGVSAGESATFTSQLLGGDLAGQDVDVTVSVTAVKEQELPGLDDDFAQTASEFDTIDGAPRRHPHPARAQQAARPGRRRPRRRARAAARRRRDPGARGCRSPSRSRAVARRSSSS